MAVGLGALVVGATAAWLVGDYVGFPLGLVVFTVVAAVLLVRQPTPRAVAARGLVLLAALVLLVPVTLHLPVFTGSHEGLRAPGRLVFQPGVYVVALVFVGLAAVLAGVGVLVDDR